MSRREPLYGGDGAAVIKFLWIPDTPEHEAKFLEEMKGAVDLNTSRVQKIQDGLVVTALNLSGEGKVKGKISELLTSNIIPALEMTKFSMSFRVLKKIVPTHPNEKPYYICAFSIVPALHEASFELISKTLGLEKFLYLFGFNYGKVQFIR